MYVGGCRLINELQNQMVSEEESRLIRSVNRQIALRRTSRSFNRLRHSDGQNNNIDNVSRESSDINVEPSIIGNFHDTNENQHHISGVENARAMRRPPQSTVISEMPSTNEIVPNLPGQTFATIPELMTDRCVGPYVSFGMYVCTPLSVSSSIMYYHRDIFSALVITFSEKLMMSHVVVLKNSLFGGMLMRGK